MTSLSTFLAIYNKARYECYIDHMAGAKALIKYLGPLVIPKAKSSWHNSLLGSYETQQLAKVISGYTYGPQFEEVHNAIIEYEIKNHGC